MIAHNGAEKAGVNPSYYMVVDNRPNGSTPWSTCPCPISPCVKQVEEHSALFALVLRHLRLVHIFTSVGRVEKTKLWTRWFVEGKGVEKSEMGPQCHCPALSTL